MSSIIIQSLIFIIFIVSEKIPMLKVFDKPRHLKDHKPVNYHPWTQTRVTQFMLCMVFLLLNVVNVFDTPLTLKQGHGHQTWMADVEPELGYNHVKFQSCNFNGTWKKANIKDFSNKEIHQLSPLNACDFVVVVFKQCVHDLLYILKIYATFQLNQIRT